MEPKWPSTATIGRGDGQIRQRRERLWRSFYASRISRCRRWKTHANILCRRYRPLCGVPPSPRRWQGLVKMGEHGCLISLPNQVDTIKTAVQANPVDTTGAGDSFNAAYLAGRANDQLPARAVEAGIDSPGPSSCIEVPSSHELRCRKEAGD